MDVEEGQQGAESTQLAELRRSRIVPRQNVTENHRYASYPKNICLDILLPLQNGLDIFLAHSCPIMQCMFGWGRLFYFF